MVLINTRGHLNLQLFYSFFKLIYLGNYIITCMQIFAHCKQCFYSFMWYSYKIKVKKLITLWYCFNLKRIIFTLNKLNVISEFHHACLRQNQNFISLSSLAWGKALIMLCTCKHWSMCVQKVCTGAVQYTEESLYLVCSTNFSKNWS